MCHSDTIYLHLVAEKTAFVANALPVANRWFTLLRQQQSIKQAVFYSPNNDFCL